MGRRLDGRRKPRRAGRSDRGDKIGGILFGILGAAILAALGMGWWWLQSHKIAYDPDTNCPLAGPVAVHAIMFDRSDAVTPQQGQQIRQYFDRLMQAASFGKRFDIYVVEGNAQDSLSPLLTICSPGNGADANRLYENPGKIRKRFKEQFLGVVRQAIDDLLQETTRETSPILESIKAAAISSFGAYELGEIDLNLTLVSDMIQHTANYSQYRDSLDFQDLSQRGEWRTLQANLKGATVRILYVLRDSRRSGGKDPIQTRGHQLFWERAISASNGNLVQIDPL